MSRIGFIGTGHIAAPMVRFLAERGHEVCVSECNGDTAQALRRSHSVDVATNQEVLDRSDIVFLCLRPHVAQDVIAALSFRADHQLVSVMAGLSLATLAEMCAPACEITMTIPLGYLEQGGCSLPACPDAAILTALFAPENPVIPVPDEAAFNMHFAVCAMAPGLLDLMDTGGRWLAEQTGDADNAMRYTSKLVTGFLAALPDGDAGQLGQERDALATEGTISLQMTQGLRDGGAHSTLRDTLSAIGDRLGGAT
ncbi:MAG: NAD(P)-binding domain-containing protein [Tateyamaria sp.]|uniref:NAD(P)-binding domain-containing protein n=1 Tax=Tateyamaria sp. TaxID=1929288 RepID=UPI0032861442